MGRAYDRGGAHGHHRRRRLACGNAGYTATFWRPEQWCCTLHTATSHRPLAIVDANAWEACYQPCCGSAFSTTLWDTRGPVSIAGASRPAWPGASESHSRNSSDFTIQARSREATTAGQEAASTDPAHRLECTDTVRQVAGQEICFDCTTAGTGRSCCCQDGRARATERPSGDQLGRRRRRRGRVYGGQVAGRDALPRSWKIGIACAFRSMMRRSFVPEVAFTSYGVFRQVEDSRVILGHFSSDGTDHPYLWVVCDGLVPVIDDCALGDCRVSVPGFSHCTYEALVQEWRPPSPFFNVPGTAYSPWALEYLWCCFGVSSCWELQITWLACHSRVCCSYALSFDNAAWTFAPSSSDPMSALFLSLSCRAPKRGIGGSGPPAEHDIIFSVLDPARNCFSFSFCLEVRGQRDVSVARGHPPFSDSHSGHQPLQGFLMWCLLCVQDFMVPLCRGLCFCFFLSLLRLLRSAWKGPSTLLGRVCATPSQGADPVVCVALGRVASPTPVFRWDVSSSGERHRRRQVQRTGLLRGLQRQCISLCAFALAFLDIPQPVLASPWLTGGHCLTLLPLAQAMVRPERHDDPQSASRRPHALHPAALTSQVVHEMPTVPWHDSDRDRRASGVISVLQSDEQVNQTDDGRLLGVHLYTPHYKPVNLTVHVQEGTPLRTVIDQVLDCAPSVPDGVMNRAVPLRPQRVQGYLSMIRFPSIIGGVHDGYAAIAINMSHVHGAYFATVMPKSLSYAELLSFIDPAAQDEDPPFEIYIGSRQYPWPPQEQVTLGDGDVVTVMRHGLGAPSMLLAEDLVNPQTWGTVSPFFHIEPLSRTCVMHGGRRFCVAPHHHTDQTLIEHAVNSLRLDLGRIATCTFCTSDLDVRGYWCPWTVAVADVPALADSEASRARQDFFLLCDLRPLGLKPVFVHTHVPKLHVSSFLSDFGIDIPPAMQLGIQGGRFSKDYVSFDDSCVLLFFVLEAEPFPRAGSSSPEEEEDQSSSASSNPPADSDHENSPHGNDCASVPAPDVEAPGLRDSTLPVGHSWNASSIPESWSGERSLAALHAWDTSAAPEQAGFAVPFPDADPPASSRDPASADVVFEISPTPLLPDTGSLAGGLEATVSQAPVSANPDVTVNMPPAADVDDASPNEPVNLRAFIYVPDTIPEMLSASAFLPCSVDAAMSAFAWARAAEDTVRYSKVVPVAPQPFSECIIAVAFPNWFDSRPVVLLDCRRINHTIFAKALYDRLNRESLLLAAGQRHDGDWDVFVHGLLHPLRPGQLIQLRTGMLVTFVPRGCGAPATYDLPARLLTREGWDPEFVVPGGGYYPGSVLLDTYRCYALTI